MARIEHRRLADPGTFYPLENRSEEGTDRGPGLRVYGKPGVDFGEGIG